MTRRLAHQLIIAGLALALLLAPMATAFANHYHWARRQSEFTVKVGDNVSGGWNSLLRRSLSEWNKNDTVTMREVGGNTHPQSCSPTNGMVEICNWPYGTQTGWLGLTRLLIDRGGHHIVWATIKLNDSFLNAGTYYNNEAARRHTICHELGHTIGLGHPKTKSCMNHSQQAIFKNLKPINRDFRELDRIYRHRDDTVTVSSVGTTVESFFDPTSLPAVPSGLTGDETVTVQTLDDGEKLVTFITWAEDE